MKNRKKTSKTKLKDWDLTQKQRDFLWALSERYIWWETPEVVLTVPYWAASQGMRDGSVEEMRKLYQLFPKDYLRAVLKNAKAGWFEKVSWSAWHHWLYSDNELKKFRLCPCVDSMQVFNPHYDILPDSQKWLWPQLSPTKILGFVLYGGTGLALRLGHRQSVDFDFFFREETRLRVTQFCNTDF